MEIILGTAASVAATIITVLGAIFYLDRKMEANRHEILSKIEHHDTKLSGEIKDVRLASEMAHKEIRADLADVKTQQAAHNERFKCIESHLNVTRAEE